MMPPSVPFALVASVLFAVPVCFAVPVANNDTFSLNEDSVITGNGAPVLSADFETVDLANGNWQFLDKIQNHLTANPQTYPVDGAGRSWKALDFDVATSNIGPWGSNALPIKRGNIDALPGVADVISSAAFGGVGQGGAENPVTTFLFRKIVTLSAAEAAISNWTLRYLVDDGMILYVNGVEVAPRINMPAGAVNTNTPAPGPGNEATYTDQAIDLTGLLVPGQNVIAVELHNTTNGTLYTSSDVALDLDIVPAGMVHLDGFTAVAGPFGTAAGNNGPAFQLAQHAAAGGFNGTGGLLARCGYLGGTQPAISPPITGARRSTSQGWARTFNLANPATVRVQVRHRMQNLGAHEATESVMAILEIDNVMYPDPTVSQTGPAPLQYLAKRVGNGSTATIDNGWQISSVDVPLAAGDHTLELGVFDEHANNPGESGEVYLDDVSVVLVTGGGVLANDTNGAVSAQLVSSTLHGSLVFNSDGSFTYTPNQNFNGVDTFTYRALNSASVQSNVATVTLNVMPVNDAPVAAGDSYSTDEDATLNVPALTGVLANDTDVDGDTLTATLVANGTKGFVTLNPNGSFTYVPNAGVSGADSFTYQASDGTLQSSIQTVSLTINDVNDPPVGVADAYEVVRNTSLVITHPNGSVITEEVLSFATRTLVGGVNQVTTPGSVWKYWDKGSYPGTGAAWKSLLSFDDSAWGAGPSELGYGDVPDNFPEATVIEDNATPGYNPGDSNRYITSYFRKILTIPNVSKVTALDLRVIRDDGIVFYINGQRAFRNNVSQTDPAYGDLASGSAAGASEHTALLASNPADNLEAAPTPSMLMEGENLFAAEVKQVSTSSSDLSFDARLVLTRVTDVGVLLNDTDEENNPLTAVLVAGPTHGSLTLNPNGTFTYTPNTNFVGNDSFTYRPNDGANNGNVTTVTITVNSGPNQRPVAVADSYSVNEDVTLNVNAATGILQNDTDPDNDPLTALLVSNVSNGSLTLNPNGSFTYTPNANYFGPDSFTYRCRDDRNNTSLNTATVSLTVNAVNDPPVAVDDYYATNPGAPLTVNAPGILANDTDIDSPAANFTAVLVAGPSGGTFSLNPNGSFTFNPPALGTYSFTYRVHDGAANSTNVGTVNIIVNGRPVANPNSYNATEDTPLTINAPGVLGNDTDPENAPLTAVLATPPNHGSVVLNANGSFTYTPAQNYAGADSFTYQAYDGILYSLPATVSLTVANVNDAPVANPDGYIVQKDTTRVVDALNGVIANDFDPDVGQTLTAQLVASTSYGSLAFNANGSFTYTPAPGYLGLDTFSYRLTDGLLFSAAATVTLHVSGDNNVVIISEIMFSPQDPNPNDQIPADQGEEFLELYNTAGYPVDLSGWTFSAGIELTIPNGVTMQPNTYLVIPADPVKFAAKYPSVTNRLNVGYINTSNLKNGGEKIRLRDATGDEIDEVEYSDEGDWAWRMTETVGGNTGWRWISGADGLGQSLQVRSLLLTNNNGQNWASAAPTPGAVNSTNALNVAPLISGVKHSPAVPLPGQQVWITANLKDEATVGLTCKVWYRPMQSTNPQPSFTEVPMFDDGAHNDGAAGDGKYGAALPAQANLTVVEFYIEAGDGTNSRTWPAPALNSTATAFLPQASSANCFYQVDNAPWTRNEAIYRIVMGAAEASAFVSSGYDRSESSDTDKNVTVIFQVGNDFDIRYLGGLRYRGASSRGSGWRPHNWKLSLREDDPWNDWTSMNLNSLSSHALVLASRLMQCAGLPTEIGTPVAVRLNGNNRMDAAFNPSPYAVYGLYSHQTPMNGEWADYAFPANGGGNLYKKSRGAGMGWALYELSPGVPNIPGYRSAAWEKQTNASENQWTDLNNFIRTMRTATNNSTNPPTINIAQVETVANIDQWARWWAFCVIINHRETNFSNGVDDDYSIYFGTADPRCHLLAHDFDTTFGSAGDIVTSATATIWQAYDTSFVGEKSFSLDIPRALFFNNKFCRKFKWHLRDLLQTVFAQANFDTIVENTLDPRDNNDWAPENVRTNFKNFMNARRAYILSQCPTVFSATSSITPSGGIYTTTDPNVTGLSGAIDGARTVRVIVNGVDANVNNHGDVWNATGVAVGLKPGLNNVLVQFLGENNIELSRQNFTYFYDDGSVVNVGSNIATSSTWTAGGGPYHVTADISVASGATLTIEPGTTVYFAPGASLTIAAGGRILAEGTEQSQIRFTQQLGETTPWDGIVINGNSGSAQNRIVWAVIERNNNVAINANNADVFFDRIRFGNATKPYLSLHGCSFLVSNIAFPTPTAAFDPILGSGGIRSGGQGIIRDCSFGKTQGYQDTIDFTGGNRPGPCLQVINCTFMGSDDDVLDLNGADAWVEGCTFAHVHRAGSTAESASAVSGGANSGNTSEVTIYRCLFYDVDQACTMKQGSSAALIQNTIVFQNNTGSLDSVTGVINCTDVGVTPRAAGFRLEGNLIWNIAALTRNYDSALTNVTLVNNILPSAWTGPGSGNSVVTNPMLNLSLISNPATATVAEIQAALELAPCSPAKHSGTLGRDAGGLIPGGIGIAGEPLSPTASTSATFSLGIQGTVATAGAFPAWSYGYTAYRYAVDGGPMSSEFPIATPIALSGLANGTHTISVLGKNDAGGWQAEPTLSKSWTVNTAAPAVLLWEVLAHNVNAVPLGTTRPDFIELRNTSSSAVSLAGYKLSDNAFQPGKYVFPAGTTVPANGYLVVYCDALPSQAGELHTGFGLDSGGETIGLFAPSATATATTPATPLDSVVFGPQIPDKSIGRAGSAGVWGLCASVTPGAANVAECDFGAATGVRLNEWLSSNEITLDDDFVELYNPAPKPVAIGGMILTDEAANVAALLALNSKKAHRIPPLSYIAASGFVRFIADGSAEGGDHLNFKLSNFHTALGFADATGRLLDHVILSPAAEDVSQGRSPDGSGAVVYFTLPTPAFSNTTNLSSQLDLLNYLRITELMFHPQSGKAEFIEFKNIGPNPLVVTGVHFASGITFDFPSMTIPAGGYAVITNNAAQFAAQFPSVPHTQWTSGNLRNEGENIRYEIPNYELGILDFDYDRWYPQTSGGGASLQIIDATAPRSTWRQKTSWQPGFPSPGAATAFGVLAGLDVNVVLPASATLDGSLFPGNFDPGDIVVQWTKVSGPGTVSFTAPNNIDTSATLSLPGAYVLRVTATAPGPVTSVSDVNVVAVAGYSTWIALAYPGNNDPNVIGKNADPDKDGIVNLVEFAMGFDPTRSNTHQLPYPEVDGDHLRIIYRRVNVPGVSYLVEASSDLVQWSSNNISNNYLSESGGVETWLAEDGGLFSQQSKRFLRVRVISTE